jgi:indole-3-glycerol phosphate synthase
LTDTLATICAHKRTLYASRKAARPLAALEAEAAAAPPPRGFLAAIAARIAKGRPALIAECKKASPSKGLIRADFDPASLARAYAAGGATCLSVLTEDRWFQGADQYLVAARAACGLPVLRKDFILEPYQVIEARALGADAILLIMAALTDEEARELEALALALGMDVLVEVHDAEERDRALQLRSPLIGINNRNLKTLNVDLQTSIDLSDTLAKDPDRILVGESGLASPTDLAPLRAAGIHAFLIGEALMRHADVEAATRSLLEAA